MRIDKLISRRQFSALAAGSSLSSIIMPASTALASSPTRVLWTGVNFIQDCGPEEPDCGAIDRVFPNLSPHFKEEDKSTFLYEKMPGKWGALIGRAQQHRIVWMDKDHTSADEFETDLAMILGITSDRAIANKYYPLPDLSFMVYEIQSYLLVVDLKKDLEIIQSYPIRILSVGNESGERTGDELKEDLKRKMWRSLSGGKSAKSSAIRVPQELQRLFSTLEFNNLKRAKVRVTKVSTSKLAKKWVNLEHPQGGEKASVDEITRDTDFKFLLGNSATSSISEKFGIGIQPFLPNASLTLVVEDFGMARGIGSLGEQKLLNTGKIDLDIRLSAKGVIFKNTKKKGYKDIFLKKCTVLVEIEAGHYTGTSDNSGQEEQSATLIGAPVLKQKLLGVSQELTTGTWSNDWYWALDMHQRLFDWFFSAIAEGKDLAKLMKGQRDRHEAREFVTRVYTKDLAQLEKEAGALRQTLMTRR